MNIQDDDGRHPIFYAVFNNSCKTLKYLLKSGYDMSIHDKENKTILHYAGFRSNLKWLQIIIDHLKWMGTVKDKVGQAKVFFKNALERYK